ncbi:MAG: hypothetical protein KAU14_09735 [Thermoplasmata archaeon]|nr:hypothetical protein [Thermoplasmata archaeon]
MLRNPTPITMTDEDDSFDTPHEINIAIRESLKKTRALKITDMAGMNSIAVGLGEVAKITVEGTAGDYFGAFNRAATLRLIGDAKNYAGDSMSGGIIRVEGNTGYGTGSYLMGGTLNVEGNTGAATGQRMYDGAIAIKGNAGSLTGITMKGGMILVSGASGEGTGHNMEGGVIYARSIKSLGKNAMELPLNKVDKSRLIEYLEVDELEFDEYKKVVATGSEVSVGKGYPVVLHSASEGYLDKLLLTPSFPFFSMDEMKNREEVDLKVKFGTGLGVLKLSSPFIIYGEGNTSAAVLREAEKLKIPILANEAPEGDSDTHRAPRIISIPPEREGITVDHLSRGKGVELVMGSGSAYHLGGELISPIPERPLDINTPEDIGNFLGLLREITRGAVPIFVTLSGENIYESVFSLARAKPDVIILKSQLPASALTVAMEALEDSDSKDEVSLLVIGEFTSGEDIIKLLALGAKGVALIHPDKGAMVENEREAFSLHRLAEEVRVLVAYTGHHAITGITKDDLRALDYTTAAVTGTKLIGYDQKLPIWRR